MDGSTAIPRRAALWIREHCADEVEFCVLPFYSGLAVVRKVRNEDRSYNPYLEGET